ncbi:MAG: Peptidoglycan-binding domain 1 protein [Betaproteobacteria bacterium]|nr:Peptidoglycan-binding domain 1 protein [Betaproteobacteria bacterium]
MKTRSTLKRPSFRRLVCAGLVAATLAGCGSPVKRNDDLGGLRRGPGNTPQRNVTDFTSGLRCMDETLFAFGTRDVVFLLEELRDESRRLGVGTRDMMISAVSEMTRRSRAVRLVTFGNDNQNIQSLLQQLEKRTPFGILPQFDIRGSVTQFDEDVVRKESKLGVSGLLEQLIGFNINRNTQINVLGFDASVVSVPDLTIVPGANSKNTVIVARDQSGVSDGVASIQKVGLSFSMNVSRNAGVAQALRNMVELASIELIGKVTRVPYWNCLGLDTNNPEVKREIEDWFFSMRDDSERTMFFQEHLRNRKFYDGPVDGKSYTALQEALGAYKKGFGYAENTPTDVAFFTEFLTRPIPAPPEKPFSTGPIAKAPTDAPSSTAQAAVNTSSAKQGSASSQPVANASPAGVPPLVVGTSKPAYKVNEEIELAINAQRSGYLYCYIQPAGGAIQRIYPNRNVKDPRIEAGEFLLLPGGQGFKISADKPGAQKIACLAAQREVYNDLPPPLRWGDFEDISLKSFVDIKAAFEKAGKLPVMMDEVTIQVTR